MEEGWDYNGFEIPPRYYYIILCDIMFFLFVIPRIENGKREKGKGKKTRT